MRRPLRAIVTTVPFVTRKVSGVLRLNEQAISNAGTATADLVRRATQRRLVSPGRRPTSLGGQLESLPVAECWKLLAGQEVGRLAFTAHSGTPVVLPVNYTIRSGEIMIRSGPGPKLNAAERRDLVAFEVDQFDRASHTGWSVLVIGEAKSFEVAGRPSPVPAGPHPWVAGPRSSLIWIKPRNISGRWLRHPTTSDATATPSTVED